jgi:hypothetical protein
VIRAAGRRVNHDARLRRGTSERAGEEVPLSRETSAVPKKTLAALAQEGSWLREIARELHLPLGQLRALSVSLHVIDGERIAIATPRLVARPVDGDVVG